MAKITVKNTRLKVEVQCGGGWAPGFHGPLRFTSDDDAHAWLAAALRLEAAVQYPQGPHEVQDCRDALEAAAAKAIPVPPNPALTKALKTLLPKT